MDALIRLKLKAAGVGDLYDIVVLVNLHPGWDGRARELAAPKRDLLGASSR